MLKLTMVTTISRSLVIAIAGLCAFALLVDAPADAKPKKKTPTAKPGYFPLACNRVSLDPAVRTLQKADSWRFSKPYQFPFYGYTPRGRNTVIWGFIKKSAVRKAPYPAPNLPACRVANHGTEDRAAHKAGKYFKMLEPVDGQFNYEFKDTFDRHIASLSWTEISPESHHPSRWGWYIDGKWAGHDATRAFEFQSRACKLMPAQTPGGWQWVRDPRYVMVSFAPNLGSPGKGYAPKGVKSLRVRAFLDRRAIPPALLAAYDTYDFGCGGTNLPPRLEPQILKAFFFDSGINTGSTSLHGYYFGEGPTTLTSVLGESKLYNTYRLDVYNPRPHYNDSTYTMVNTTGVAGGGLVRGIVQSTKDALVVYDEMSYCDPNYTLRNMQLRKGKKHYKKSLYFKPYTFSVSNRPSVRWVFGRLTPNPATLTPEGQAANQNPASQALFGWEPIYCDK